MGKKPLEQPITKFTLAILVGLLSEATWLKGEKLECLENLDLSWSSL